MLAYKVDFCRLQAKHLEPQGYRPEAVSYHSTSLEGLSSFLLKKKKPNVLNLGPLTPGVFNLIGHTSPFLLNYDPAELPYQEYLQLIENSPKSFDLILVWDRLLYLTYAESKKLLTVITNHSKSGSELLAYSTVRHILPAIPSKFSLDANHNISVCPVTAETKNCDNCEFAKLVEGWRCHHSVQLRNSFREHLYIKT